MKQVSVYLAGPITAGDQFWNTGRAIQLADELKQRGIVPFVPHWGFCQQMYRPWTYEEWLAYDFVWLAKCDALLRMKGCSLGADREVVFAQGRGIPCFYEEDNGLERLTRWRDSR